MLRIRIFSSFCDSTVCKEIFCKSYCLQNDTYKDRFVLVDDDSFTHIVILNTAMPATTLPSNHVLGLAWEPVDLLYLDHQFIQYAQQHIGRYLVGRATLAAPFVVGYGFLSHNPPVIGKSKDHLVSIVLSDKQWAPGHSYRHQLVSAILATDLNVHIYGRGASAYGTDVRIRGAFIDNEPYEHYAFTVVIENYSSELYISEKYTNPLLNNCVSLYWGASRIEQIFGQNCCHRLSKELDKDLDLIRNVLENPDAYQLDLVKARETLVSGSAFLPEFLSNYWTESK